LLRGRGRVRSSQFAALLRFDRYILDFDRRALLVDGSEIALRAARAEFRVWIGWLCLA
jgi:hypothetical protein